MMNRSLNVLNKREEFKNLKRSLSPNQKLGLVPTMGNLHEGHLNLVRESLKDNDLTCITIFVNPKQFGPHEDFDKYPRTLEADLQKLSDLNSKSELVVFAPLSPSEMFPEGFNTSIEVEGLDQVLCGRYRSGHFKGVTTVVYQLLSLSQADRAYFGQKDFQQFKIIERMVKDLNLPVELHMVPIARTEEGLALSSRNQYLSESQRQEALTLNKTLVKIGQEWRKNPKNCQKLIDHILFSDRRFQYLEVLKANNLSEATPEDKKVVVAGAFFMGDTRLIDNILIEKQG